MNMAMVGGIYRRAASWIASGLSTLFAVLWAFWGSVEAFHEGWFARDWTTNFLGALMYLIPMTLIVIPAVVSISGKTRLGLALHLTIAAIATWRFELHDNPAVLAILAGPLCLAGVLYLFFDPDPIFKRWALRIVVVVPIVTALVCGTRPAYLAATREDDGNYGIRVIDGNEGLRLAWAPQGPGWPEQPATWIEAQNSCDHLSRDGMTVEADPIRVWRLPSVDEAVRSGIRHGKHAGGVWDPVTRKATYRIQPNKETPLWTRYSQAMYRWTSTERQNDPRRAYRYVWNGITNTYPKHLRIHFRCVSLPPPPQN